MACPSTCPPALVVVWSWNLAAGPCPTEWLAALSENDRSRAGRLRQQADWQRFTTGRAMLRWAASQTLGLPAAALDLAVSPHGKPQFTGAAADLHASVSHAGDAVAVALCREAPVGLDLEPNRQLADPRRLATDWFSPAEAALLRTTPDETCSSLFLDLWCRKEAVLKAHGAGLRLGLRQPEVAGLPPAGAVVACDGRVFAVRDVPLGSGLHGAVAVAGVRVPEVIVRHLDQERTTQVLPSR